MMSNSTEKSNINFFFRLIILLGIIPPHSTIMGNNKSILQRFYKLYVIFLILIIILVCILTIFYHYRIIQTALLNFTLVVTDSALDVTATICNMATILAPTFLYSASLDALLTNYQYVCRKTSFMEEMLKITSTKQFIIHLIVSHIIIVTLIAYDAYVTIMVFGLGQYSAFIFRKVQIYHNFMTILTIYIFVKFIKAQLEKTNSYLTEILEARGITGENKNLAIEAFTTSDDNDKTACSEIRQVTKVYENHLLQIALFNKVFGCQMFFLTFTFVMGFLNSINLIILSYISNSHVDFQAELIIVQVLWTLWQLVIGGLAVVKCTEAEETGRKIGDVCLNALTNLPYSSENERIKEELNFLNCLVNQKSPTFSAAGFFSINYTLLLSIIGSITSYVIVLIQFNKV
nr:gustatory receptor 3 [Podabrus annulatus]